MLNVSSKSLTASSVKRGARGAGVRHLARLDRSSQPPKLKAKTQYHQMENPMPTRDRPPVSDSYGFAAASAVQAVGGEGWFLAEDRGVKTDVFSLNSRRVVAGVSAEIGRQIVDDHNAAESKRVADASHSDAARAAERESN